MAAVDHRFTDNRVTADVCVEAPALAQLLPPAPPAQAVPASCQRPGRSRRDHGRDKVQQEGLWDLVVPVEFRMDAELSKTGEETPNRWA